MVDCRASIGRRCVIIVHVHLDFVLHLISENVDLFDLSRFDQLHVEHGVAFTHFVNPEGIKGTIAALVLRDDVDEVFASIWSLDDAGASQVGSRTRRNGCLRPNSNHPDLD